jgi:putative tryptophan/tyrosine transport system substrate-binding protein
MIRRRDFITLLGGATAAWPLAARAQQTRVPTVGFVGADASAWRAWTAAFVERLGALGWIEGRTLAIQYRWSEGRPERIAEVTAEFVRLNVDVIFTNFSSALEAKRATSIIPVVFVLGADPVGSGLVSSLARPGGNVTGLSTQQAELAGKRIQVLREVIPHLRRLAIMSNAGNPGLELEMRGIQTTAHTLSLEIVPLEIRRAEDIAAAFAALKPPADALYIAEDALVLANRTRIITFALGARLPTMSSTREFVQVGALLSYGADYLAQFRRGAELVDKILRGAKPADIPVEQPTKFELVINLTTAKAIGLTIPEAFLARADEIIE